MDFVTAIENALGKEAVKNMMPMQPGDVLSTQADTSALSDDVGFKPDTSVTDGINQFVAWYRDYFKV